MIEFKELQEIKPNTELLEVIKDYDFTITIKIKKIKTHKNVDNTEQMF